MESIRKTIQPIKKKWVYHFIVSPKTSIIEKPEWYLDQTLKWIHEHIDAVESKSKIESKVIKPAEVRQNFILCMLELAQMRLTKDMNQIRHNLDDPQSELILIHTYNEVIQFTKVARQLLGERYNTIDDQYDVLGVLSDQKLSERIIDVEWEYANKNLNDITNAENLWDPVLEGEYVDSYKIPRCADRFLLQIKSITERIECFRQLDCQLQLIELQLSLFSKFLQFLKRSSDTKPATRTILTDIFFFNDESTIDLTRISRILNGVNFLRLIIKEKCFIPNKLIDELDTTLVEKHKNVAQDYKTFFNKLINKVVAIYECVDCDLKKYFEFIKPKLSHDVHEIIREEASKLYETKQTRAMLEGLSFS